MRTILTSAAILTLALTTVAADAKEYKASYQSPSSLGKSCAKAGGKSFNGENSYGCNFKNGNLKECSKRQKGCIIVTARTAPPSPSNTGNVMQPGTGLLDPTPGFSSGGPSSTGSPLGGGGGGAAPPPAQIR